MEEIRSALKANFSEINTIFSEIHQLLEKKIEEAHNEGKINWSQDSLAVIGKKLWDILTQPPKTDELRLLTDKMLFAAGILPGYLILVTELQECKTKHDVLLRISNYINSLAIGNWHCGDVKHSLNLVIIKLHDAAVIISKL